MLAVLMKTSIPIWFQLHNKWIHISKYHQEKGWKISTGAASFKQGGPVRSFDKAWAPAAGRGVGCGEHLHVKG